MICTEYLARGYKNNFDTHLPLFKQHHVGAINWGLVSGRTQTIYPWNHPYKDTTVAVWHHDIFWPDGRPYRPRGNPPYQRTDCEAIVQKKTAPRRCRFFGRIYKGYKQKSCLRQAQAAFFKWSVDSEAFLFQYFSIFGVDGPKPYFFTVFIEHVVS
ncbi:MAG: hypothetical protein HC842_05395 [Cytophagales bacterium]|nr:hypothetical protein [Cytophagales bacterium]